MLRCRTSRQASSTGCYCSCLGIKQRVLTCVFCERRKPSFYLISFLLFFLPQARVPSVHSLPDTRSLGPSRLHPISMPIPWGTPVFVQHPPVPRSDDTGQCRGTGCSSFIAPRSLTEMTNREKKIKAGGSEILLKIAFLKGGSGEKTLRDESGHM